MLTRILSFAAVAISRVLTQFKDAVEIIGLLNGVGAQIQELDDAAVTTKEVIRDPVNATGATLDKIGQLVGAQSRGSLNDLNFSRRVQTQILVNTSKGTADELLDLLKIFLPEWNNGTDLAKLRESYASGFNVGSAEFYAFPGTALSGRLTTTRAEEAARHLKAAAIAGVRTQLTFRDPSINLNQAFRFAGGTPPETAVGFNVGKLYGVRE